MDQVRTEEVRKKTGVMSDWSSRLGNVVMLREHGENENRWGAIGKGDIECDVMYKVEREITDEMDGQYEENIRCRSDAW